MVTPLDKEHVNVPWKESYAKAFVLVMITQSHLSKICTMIYTNKGDTHTHTYSYEDIPLTSINEA